MSTSSAILPAGPAGRAAASTPRAERREPERRRGAAWAGLAAIAAESSASPPPPAGAHGLAGRRFFPATLVIEDPFVADELSLPSFSTIKTPEGARRAFGAEFSKTITPNLGVSVGTEYLILESDGSGGAEHFDGFANPEVGVKYSDLQERRSREHHLAGLRLGDRRGGQHGVRRRRDFLDHRPSLLFGQGLGDLPDALAYLRPLAITGVFGAEIPLANEDGNSASPTASRSSTASAISRTSCRTWAFRSFAEPDQPDRRAALQTPIEGEEKWKTTGTVNPGLIWAGKYVEVGVEAIIPINQPHREGRGGARPRCTSSWTISGPRSSGRFSRRRAIDGAAGSDPAESRHPARLLGSARALGGARAARAHSFPERAEPTGWLDRAGVAGRGPDLVRRGARARAFCQLTVVRRRAASRSIGATRASMPAEPASPPGLAATAHAGDLQACDWAVLSIDGHRTTRWTIRFTVKSVDVTRSTATLRETPDAAGTGAGRARRRASASLTVGGGGG